MAFEVIPFKAFLNPVTLAPLSVADGGLTFFIGTGLVLLGLVALEKMGVKVNTAAVRWSVIGSMVLFAAWAVLTNHLFRITLFGF